jgi:dienelactone hydrolase
MSIIIVSDVFGKTSALVKFYKEINAHLIVDPYNGKDMGFKSEKDAYGFFMDSVGLDLYLTKLSKAIESIAHIDTLIGFSVGASTIWRLSEKEPVNSIGRAVCFYGSQIRNFTKINPFFDMELVFPKSEPHFNIMELQDTLLKKQKVKIVRTCYLHGFMNYHSNNFNQTGYADYVKLLNLKFKNCISY